MVDNVSLSANDIGRLSNLGSIVCTIFDVKEREGPPKERKTSEPQPVVIPRLVNHKGLVTRPGHQTLRRTPSYKFALASKIPIASTKLYYASSDTVRQLKNATFLNFDVGTSTKVPVAIGNTTVRYYLKCIHVSVILVVHHQLSLT
jgi:hypothetical protein